MRPISIVMAYYDNPGMLRRHVDAFTAFPSDMHQSMELVIVDDCSPKKPANFANVPFAYQIWRMGVDVRWNQDACRNIGVKAARHDWILMTDIDHMIPELTLRSCMIKTLDRDTAYRFSRVNDVTFNEYKFHPNSWLMHRDLFDRIGGYDERFAGWYGTDWDFRDRAVIKAKCMITQPEHLVRVGREHTPDASCPREFGRKTDQDAKMIAKLRSQRRNEKPQLYRFPHSLVAKCP